MNCWRPWTPRTTRWSASCRRRTGRPPPDGTRLGRHRLDRYRPDRHRIDRYRPDRHRIDRHRGRPVRVLGKNDRVTWLELDGAVNVRDLGGLPAGDGRQVVPGRLLRGDDLNDLSPADVTLLVGQLGLTTVIDLRSPGEVRARGPGPLTRGGLVRHRQHSLLPELGLTPAADAMTARVERAQARYPDDARCGLYLGYLEERP